MKSMDESGWMGVAAVDHQVSKDIHDLAETLRELLPGIDGEGLYDEAIRLAEEVQCMEDSPGGMGHIWMQENPNSSPHTLKMLKNRTVQNGGNIVIDLESD